MAEVGDGGGLFDPERAFNRDEGHFKLRGVGFLEMTSELGRLRKLFDDDELREDAIYAYTLAVPAPKLNQNGAMGLFRKVETEAGELSELETELVEQAVDIRLMRNGFEPVFHPEDTEHDEEECDDPTHHHLKEAAAAPATAPAGVKKAVGRNDPCPCGSGKKYKKCCGA